MRVVDEVPAARWATKYPYDAIEEAVTEGQVVELSAEEYGVSPQALKVSIYNAGKSRGWTVQSRGDMVYVSKA